MKNEATVEISRFVDLIVTSETGAKMLIRTEGRHDVAVDWESAAGKVDDDNSDNFDHFDNSANSDNHYEVDYEVDYNNDYDDKMWLNDDDDDDNGDVNDADQFDAEDATSEAKRFKLLRDTILDYVEIGFKPTTHGSFTLESHN